jgi:hypothetical protein
MHVLIDAVLFVLIGAALILAAKRRWKSRGFIWEIWREFRPLMALEMIALLAATVTVIVLLLGLGAPFTWGWFSLLTGHSGNAGVAPIVDAGQSGYAIVKLAALGIFCLLVVLMPFFAHGEEVDYRKGRETWRRILPASVRFGLVHMWVGVPLSVGLALALPGLYLGWKYKRAFEQAMREAGMSSVPTLQELMRNGDAQEEARAYGVHRSTVYHTCYNSLAMLLVLIAVLTGL